MLQFSLKDDRRPYDDSRPWYDNVHGIALHLTTLEGFTQLAHERHVAGYVRKERLNEFIVLGGRYSFDSCGNLSRAEDSVFVDALVSTREGFWKLAGDKSKTFNHDPCLPLPGLQCAHCKRTWGILDCYDAYDTHSDETLPMDEFVGKTLGEVKLIFEKRTDALYRNYNNHIRSDRFIDLSLKYPGSTKDWEKDMVKNKNGWKSGEHDGVTDDYVFQEGDSCGFDVWHFYHRRCLEQHRLEQVTTAFTEVFTNAGYTTMVFHPIPNEYHRCEYDAPWFMVDTEIGTIKIGWRKRVINIEWSRVLSYDKFHTLFAGENVTLWGEGIHAWGYAKATEYLKAIRNATMSERKK